LKAGPLKKQQVNIYKADYWRTKRVQTVPNRSPNRSHGKGTATICDDSDRTRLTDTVKNGNKPKY